MEALQKYIDSLPNSLPKAEQKKLLEEYKQTHSEEVRNILVEHNLMLVAFVVKDFYGHRLDQDDLMQIGTLALVRAIELYDSSRGTAFTTYAYAAIRGRILNELDGRNRTKDAIWQDWTSEGKIGKPQSEEVVDIFDVVSSGEDFVKEYAEREFFLKFLNNQGLSAEDKYILINSLGLFRDSIDNPKIISEKLGITEHAVEKRKRELLNGLRNYYITSGKIGVDAEFKAVINYVNSTNNEYHKEILEYVYGLNGKPKLKLKETAEVLGAPYVSVSQTFRRAVAKAAVRGNFKTVTDEEIESYLDLFGSEREKFVANHHYGFKGSEKLSGFEIAEKCGVREMTVYKILERLRDKVATMKLKEENGIRLDVSDVDEYYKNKASEAEKLIIESEFGFYGCKKMSREELSKVVGSSTNALSLRIIRLIKKIEDYKLTRSIERE